MRSLGWAEYLQVEFSKDRKTLKVTYWMYVVHQSDPTYPAATLLNHDLLDDNHHHNALQMLPKIEIKSHFLAGQ